MSSLDLYQALQGWALVIAGLIALILGLFRGELGIAGLGVLALVIGVAFLAITSYFRRNKLPPRSRP